MGRLTAQEKGRDRIRMGAVLDMPVLECRADLSGRWGKRRAERALKRLARAGAEQGLLPAGVPWPELMERSGLTPPDAGARRRGPRGHGGGGRGRGMRPGPPGSCAPWCGGWPLRRGRRRKICAAPGGRPCCRRTARRMPPCALLRDMGGMPPWSCACGRGKRV